MSKNIIRLSLLLFLLLQLNNTFAWDGMLMPELHVEGRYLKDSHGHIVELHGFAQTYSPWFNEQNSKWNNYNVNVCLEYNQGIIDGMLEAGWMMNFIRLHMDPYWSNKPGVHVNGESDISAFDFNRFKKYLDEVFLPMAEYAISKGLYVIMRPPGVCPDEIAVGDEYNQYLINIWDYVAQHPKIKNNLNIMFELANEPVNILGTDGTYGSGTQGHFDNLKTYFQTIVNTIRTNADNILWIPGLGWQSQYQGYAVNPIEGENIGYAVHVYPGWFNSGQGYEPFQRGWNDQVQPVADFAPIVVTEMDWAPERHSKSWGKDITGTAGGDGFGANFKKIADECGNVSWLLFTGPDLLDDFGDPNAPADIVDFLTDPEACPWPIYHWYQDYANEYDFSGVTEDYSTMMDLVLDGDSIISVLNKSSVGLKVNAVFADGHIENVSSLAQITVDNPSVVQVVRGRIFTLTDGIANISIAYTDSKRTTKHLSIKVSSSTFPLTNELFNPKIWENGTFDEATKTLKTGPWGFGGWQYNGIDLSEYKYIVARLSSENTSDVTFNVYDGSSYWGSPTSYKFGSNRQVVVMLNQAVKNDGTMLNPEHIYIAGFWSNGNNPFVIDTVFLSNSSEYDPPVVYLKNIDGSEIEALTGFHYNRGEGPSACQSFIVSGDILSNYIEIIAPSGFELSLDSTLEFSSKIKLDPSNEQVFDTEVFVRLKAELVSKTYSGNIKVNSTGAFSKIIALSGTVAFPTDLNEQFLPNSKVVSINYFTLTGQKIKDLNHHQGIFIIQKIMNDGTVSTSKFYNKGH